MVSDIVMPGLSGLELLGAVRALRASLPVVLVTGAGTYDTLSQALTRGAAGLVTSRSRTSSCRARSLTRSSVQPSHARSSGSGCRPHARQCARERDRGPRLLSARALRAPGRTRGADGRAARSESTRRRDDSARAILHDVGKIGIPDRVLLKPEPLDEEERRIIETHPEIGDKLLEPLDLLAAARPIVRHHHERWDGSGYPDGLAGTDIPFGARIVSVVDSIEVMSSRQLYREPRTPDEIVGELIACRAKQWDPQIVDLALRLIESGELQLANDGLRLLEPAAVVPASPGLAVLLVEDDDKYALLVTSALERALDGAVIARAHSVASAAELVTASEWSLAIVADGLEEGHGMRVLDALRLSNPRLPVVMVTALKSDVTAVEAFRHGASDCVVKGDAYIEALAARVRTLVTA